MQAVNVAMAADPVRFEGQSTHDSKEQDYYHSHKNGLWEPLSRSPGISYTKPPIDLKMIRLISWNIDVLVPYGNERMSAALRYLNDLVSSSPTNVPIVVFLQEMSISDLQQIRKSSWIQQRFNVTDMDATHWASPHYGTTTLIDHRLNIACVYREPWVSKFGRDGLFVDITLSHAQFPTKVPKVLRLCNTHLESLIANPPIRPLQVASAAKYLRAPEVVCALFAGDLNAIEPFDRTLHSDNFLKDAYLELGGVEDTDDGYTWGQQGPQWMREKFGCSRMDKIFFRGELQPKRFERIGMGVKVAEEHVGPYKVNGQEGWVTDHYGIMGDFELGGRWEFKRRQENEEGVQSSLS